MKQKTNRWLSMLLAFIMLLMLVPTTNIFAGYEDGEDCWHCGHYHWDGYLCGCGACSTSCTNADCWLETHCNNCGMCLMEDGGFCSECNYCTECMEESGWHCSECKQCFLGDEDGNLCGNCGRCASCVAICQDCGFCQECFEEEEDEMHCPMCGNCYEVSEPCEFVENNHCKECCYPCDQCGRCTYNEDALATCPDCGLCVDCCEENSKEAGCDDGSVCVESGDWLDGLCIECGIFFNDSSDMCDLCVDSAMARCKDCCAASSQCSEGMCENDPDYDEHFCVDCGQCFHDSEQCDTCLEPRCKECCEDITMTNYGCSHGICADSGELEEHLDECDDINDGEYTDDHDAMPSIRWSYDKNVHYHECRFCESEEHYTSKAAHTFDKNGVCTVCGSHAGSEPYIYRQPKNFRCKVSVYGAYDEYPEEGLLWSEHNFATFTVVAKGGQGKLSYQWYGYYYGRRDCKIPGATSPTLKIEISTEGCMIADYDYYCVITDEAGKSVKTNIASIRAEHAYGSKFAENTELEKGESIENADYKGGTFYYLNDSGKKESVTAQPSKGHRYPCMSEVDDEHIHYKNSTPVHHTFGVPKVEGRSARSGAASTDKLYRIICTACGYTTFRESHKHNFTFTSFGNVWPNVDMEKTSALTKEKLITGHVVACSVEGCEATRMEMHDWKWKYTGGDCDFPSETEKGYYTRKCKVCEYEPNDFNAKDKDGNIISWTKDNILIVAENATASKILANDGDKLTLRIMRNADTMGKRCTGWTVEYQIAEDDAVQVVNLTGRHPFENNGDDSYTFTVSVGIYGTGGVLIFKPSFADCTMHEYQTVGYKDAVCMKDGYKGDRVCTKCGQYDPNDVPAEEKVIPATKTEHEGDLLPLYYDRNDKTPTTDRSSGKRYHFKAGSCTVKGYEGDFRCSKCESTVLGKWGYQHNEEADQRNWSYPSCFKAGYTGDFYCRDCGKLSRRGEKVPAIGKHTEEEEGYFDLAPSTCTATGLKKYKCFVCNIVMREEILPALGHDWVIDEANSTATIAAYKCNREDCVATKLENVASEKFNITVTNGTATSAGSAISKAARGTVVTVTADPAEAGKQFDKWEVIYGGVTIADVNSATTTFTMGSEAVKIKATYKDTDPSHTHTYGEWVSDGTNHWKACACSQISELAAHTASDWIIDTPAAAAADGAKHKECTVCHRVLESDTIPALGYTITFELNYSSSTATTAQTDKDGKLAVLPVPSRSGYRFDGWYTETAAGTKINGDYTFTADTTIYAHWIKQSTGSRGSGRTTTMYYTVSFETNGGNKVVNQSVTGNSVVKEPTAPTKDGFDFAGWYTDKELKTKYDFSAKVAKSFTLYAAWTQKDNSVNQIILTIGEKSAQVFGKAAANDVAPKIVNDRTMLPARFVAENLGAKVEWNGEKQLVTITGKNLKTGEDVIILITIGAQNAVVNGKSVKLDSPAFIENNRTYTPIRFVSEELGASVEWLGEEKKVVITKVQAEEK